MVDWSIFVDMDVERGHYLLPKHEQPSATIMAKLSSISKASKNSDCDATILFLPDDARVVFVGLPHACFKAIDNSTRHNATQSL